MTKNWKKSGSTCSHPSTLMDPELYAMASKVHDGIYEFYQRAATKDMYNPSNTING